MGWIQKLCETYDACSSMVGYSSEERERPLLPICHITAQANIEIVLDRDGNFLRASVITDRRDATTIIPCTEESASRGGKKPKCHPLCDNLQYIASDFTEYGGTVTVGFSKNPKEPFRDYVKELSNWCSSGFVHPKAMAVLSYIKKEKLIKDLIKHKILFVGAHGKFLLKKERERKENQNIFDVINDQSDAFVRWCVEIPGDPESSLWKDKTLWDSWIKYYLSTMKKKPLCHVTGGEALLSTQHPKYIRAKGDGAKIISSNDKNGFTFRGRFLTAEQACGVSFAVTQKAHNALIWLISRQGKVFFVKSVGGRKEPGLTVVAWATSGKLIPKVTDDPLTALGFDELPNDQPIVISTAQDIANRFKKRMLGYASELGNTNNIVVMSLDSASRGRLAIVYYRENLTGSDFLQRIEHWHKTCEWIHEYRYHDIENERTGKTERFFQPFIGAPAPSDIAEAAYGRKVDDKLKKTTVERILPCIIDGQQIPRDLVEAAVRRASNRIAMEEWEWNKTLRAYPDINFLYVIQPQTK